MVPLCKMVSYFFCVTYLLCCCATGRGTGALVSDIGDGSSEYRAIQNEQRERDAELAITGSNIEHEIGEIRSGLRELEQSIIAIQGTEQEIGEIIQRVRSRPVEPNIIEEWRNRRFETRNGDREAGEGDS